MCYFDSGSIRSSVRGDRSGNMVAESTMEHGRVPSSRSSQFEWRRDRRAGTFHLEPSVRARPVRSRNNLYSFHHPHDALVVAASKWRLCDIRYACLELLRHSPRSNDPQTPFFTRYCPTLIRSHCGIQKQVQSFTRWGTKEKRKEPQHKQTSFLGTSQYNAPVVRGDDLEGGVGC